MCERLHTAIVIALLCRSDGFCIGKAGVHHTNKHHAYNMSLFCIILHRALWKKRLLFYKLGTQKRRFG